LDVKVGSGAFMKTRESAVALAEQMVAIGKNAGRRTAALITNMDIPLGRAIGNSLEVIEAVETLSGKGPKDITDLCLELAANMLYLSLPEHITLTECRRRTSEALDSGAALKKLEEMAAAQGGDISCLKDTSKFPAAAETGEYTAASEGYITSIDAEGCGIAASLLGAGREKAGEPIDHAAGIVLLKKPGEYVKRGEPLAMLYASDQIKLVQGLARLDKCYNISAIKPSLPELIIASV
ncbi:MAG: thymidine phosphorylase, partial [Oscillospiraceae bacterium]|nr:thymidine phosphorylase [Oscillospiraceae bacterium]